MSGFVYIITNRTMPGLVKIGRTTLSPSERVKQLHTTGVPAPFELYAARRFHDHADAEKRIHEILAPYREESNREFFRYPPQRAKRVMNQVVYELGESKFGLLSYLPLRAVAAAIRIVCGVCVVLLLLILVSRGIRRDGGATKTFGSVATPAEVVLPSDPQIGTNSVSGQNEAPEEGPTDSTQTTEHSPSESRGEPLAGAVATSDVIPEAGTTQETESTAPPVRYRREGFSLPTASSDLAATGATPAAEAPKPAQRESSIPVDELAGWYDRNSATAEQFFRGKVVRLSGTVLKAKKQEVDFGKVHCRFNDPLPRSMVAGQRVVVEGIVTAKRTKGKISVVGCDVVSED